MKRALPSVLARGSLLSIAVVFGTVAIGRSATFNIANGDVTGLKNAIVTANSNAAHDTINLAADGSYVLTSVDTSAGADGATGLPIIRGDGGHNLTINGNGATIQRNTSGPTAQFRLLRIEHDTNAATTISRVRFNNGSLNTGDGGAIATHGRLFMTDCTISGNNASGGGAIANFHGTVELTRCTLHHNTTSGGGRGAGILNKYPSTRLTLTNCTLSANFGGGGIYIDWFPMNGEPSHITITSCTFHSSDIVAGYAGGYVGTMTLRNTLFADSYIKRAADSQTGIVSEGYNMSFDHREESLNAPTDQIGVNARVDPAGVTSNPGPLSYTPTLALMSGSPAIDKGNRFSTTTDQRGIARPSDYAGIDNAAGGDGSDIGAYEAQGDPKQYGFPSLVVTTSEDSDDGLCTANDCTLREAIARANAVSSLREITFSAFVGPVITLDRNLGKLIISDDSTIAGPGARQLAISANDQSPVLHFTDGTSTISGLTIRDGWAAAPSGSGGWAAGGGIYNEAQLTLNDCHVSENVAIAGSGSAPGGSGGPAEGGGIFNDGSLTLNRTSFIHNAAHGAPGAAYPPAGDVLTRGGAGGSGRGSAVFNNTGRTLVVDNCTFFNNNASGGSGGGGSFGGNGGHAKGAIFNLGRMTVTGCTLSGNYGFAGAGGQGSSSFRNGSAGTGTGGLSAGGGDSIVRNTLSAANTGVGGVDADGSFSSSGYNLIGVGDYSAGFGAAGDQVGTFASPIDPKLGPMKFNGGPTDTIALLEGSPAVDQGKSFLLGTDQRGERRPADSPGIANASGGDGADIGAFEAPPGTAPPPASPTPTPTETATPVPTPPTRLANISTRVRVQTGDNVLIGGFIVTGSMQKKIIVRAIGPSLPLGDRLANPRLELFNGNGTPIASNDNWQDAPNRQEIIDSAVAPPNDLEAAILQDVEPGLHTAVVSGAGGGTGVGLVEVYDLGSAQDSKLANISTRGLVQTGDNVMIGGLIITGSSPQKVIVRAIGPSLPLNDKLADPLLELFDGNGNPMSSNNNWNDTQQSEIEATGVAPGSDLESAIVTSLPPALYTAIVSGVNSTTGVALVEVYALP